MYAISFILIDYMIKRDIKKKFFNFSVNFIDNFMIISLISLLIGGRLGYVIFYDITYYLNNPIKILMIWQGGMSFHGGLIGAFIGLLIFSKNQNIKFFDISDLISLYIPIGLGLGRIGNFINGELYGKPTNTDWGVIFPAIDQIPRHPSMLYEAFLEGLVLFFLMRMIFYKNPSKGILTSYFLIIYGVFRFSIEFLRVPDSHIGYLYNNWLTMGQLLCIPMIITGIIIIYFLKNSKFR
tara:strand:+ start:485 stop:1198 length:714 start_codon:yes stop_codon:yes gene_type:complete